MRLVLSPKETLEERIRTREAVVAVVGLGYVGLPLAVAYAQAGYTVVGVDLDEARAAAVNAGISHIGDVASPILAAEVQAGRVSATTRYEALRGSDVIFICVPTPFTRNREPDTSRIRTAGEGIAAALRPGHLVILRSTSYPGTTEELLRPLLEGSGHKVGDEIFLAFAPERVDPGRRDYTVHNTPVLVGGGDPESTRLAALILGQVTARTVVMSSPAAAEMAKLLENVFRNVNIALVNQLAMLCERMGLDVWEVIDAASTKPYGFLPFYPGPGVGGHCIPVDPYYLAWKAREYDFHMDFIELAARVNDEMPYYVATRILLALNGSEAASPRQVLILGVTFKRDVEDYRHSPALKIMELLHRQGVGVHYHDPFVPELPFEGRVLRSVPLTPENVGRYDCLVIAADHSAFDPEWIVAHGRKVFDTRNSTRHVTRDRHKIKRL